MDDYWESQPLPRGRALDRGLTDNDLRALQSRNGWTRLRRGHYLSPTLADGLTKADRHRLLVEATLPNLADDAVISHQSAAVLHGVALWHAPLDRVHVTRNTSSGGRCTTRSHTHVAPLPQSEIVQIAGLPVVSLARAIADLSRSLSFEQAVIAGDEACRRLGLAPADVQVALEALRGRRGVNRGRHVAAFLDGRSESAGESLSRAILSKTDLPTLALQFEVHDPHGELIGRADFALPEHGVLGEFDGKVKYGRYLRKGQTAGDAVFEEKRREDRLRDAGWQVVRWTWGELARPGLIVDRFRRAMDRGAASARPTGRPPRAFQ